MNKVYKLYEFSEIIFGDSERVGRRLRVSDPLASDLGLLWNLEYLISNLKPNKKLGFTPDQDTLKDIISVSKKIIRTEIIRQSRSLSPIAVNMIFDSLSELSKIHGFYSFTKLAESLSHRGDYLSNIFRVGKASDSFARDLLKTLVSEGVSSGSMAVQWTELYLKNKGFKYLDFDFYVDKFKLLSGDRVADSAIVRAGTQEHQMALTIAYAITGGRSWMTGEPLSFDDALLHHILHDEHGNTLYGLDYENKYSNFACLSYSKGENQKVEGRELRFWENKFVYMWQQFKAGNYEAATEHWKDFNPQYQADFLKERRSSKYLDKWLGQM